ncbi:hypothetical protein [Pseudobacillus badius]|uniref:hypothetical protein n=1 Tax=Bacillus badius TaxID=1455 RepID=UPI0024A2DCE8|nr:hypothetical protein [Bacillus badius]GLY09577.1 hypothetical protein Bbad01_07930 [Bacillus badius]
MIKEAIEYIIGLGNTRVVDIGLQTYSTEKMYLIEDPTPTPLAVHSLSGLVDYISSKFDGSQQVMIHVKSPTRVECFSTYNSDMKRDHFISAEAMLPSFTFDRFYDSEDFNIKLQSVFVQNEDRDIMLKVVGNIKEENVRTVGDNGVSQAVQAKTGVATVAMVEVPNPVTLKPYRTFVEVEQPESEFIFRMKNGPMCALFEADGGAWELAAMKRVKEYLIAALEEEIEAGQVVVIA